MNVLRFLIKVEIALNKLHSISWTQIQKIPFLWLKFTSRLNSKKWPKIHYKSDLGILLLRKLNNIVTRESAILFTENVLKQLKKNMDEKTYFSIQQF